MIVAIDKNSGFCFGVEKAVKKAEEMLQQSGSLYSLGDIVHNEVEVERLDKLGLTTIDHDRYFTLHDETVLIRAHGEPPSTYEYAVKNNIKLIDATCPIVLKLQERIRKDYLTIIPEPVQVVIYGKLGHAEVNGLVGQTAGNAIVVEHSAELEKINFSHPISLYSQTTKDLDGFQVLEKEIKKRAVGTFVQVNDTICRQVSNRIPGIRDFAVKHELILFVSGKKSSNGKLLFEMCQEANSNSKFIGGFEEVDLAWFKGVQSVGVCGATSTPKKLLEDVAHHVEGLVS
ncbi:MAG: 4-hydroxy-3-methylbut-2-enyl diphosphate reductase [Bacteroidia bacterium]|nr:4-hydroxy-3-methylbut-2-enyl diphosphate reductase [Bacteroidia bacterium]